MLHFTSVAGAGRNGARITVPRGQVAASLGAAESAVEHGEASGYNMRDRHGRLMAVVAMRGVSGAVQGVYEFQPFSR